MSDLLRVTSLYSGLDTQSIVTQMVSKQQAKVDSAIKKQKQLEVKMSEWKELNSNIYSFYSSELFNSRLQSTYSKMETKSSSNALSVSADSNANIGEYSAKILSMAKTGYVTGSKLDEKLLSSDKVVDKLGLNEGTYLFNGENIEITNSTTISDFTKALSSKNTNVTFDTNQNRFFIAAKEMGKEKDFDLSSEKTSDELLDALGLSNMYYLDDNGKYYLDKEKTMLVNDDELSNIKQGNASIRILGENANLMVNGAYYESNSNTFNVNGLTMTINNYSDDEINISTRKDTSNISSVIHNFFDKYNSLMNSMTTRYNTKNDYKPLTEEEKDVMSDREIEKWEEKVAEGSLGKDSRLGQLINSMKNVLAQGVVMDDDSKMYLSDLGIQTKGYFDTDKNERNSYTISDDKLEQAITSDEDKVVEFFTKLSNNLYDNLTKEMASSEYSSMYKVYNDKQMTTQYSKYEKEIKEMEERLAKLEDKYYNQFSKMEVALAQLQSNTSAISSLFNF